MFFSSQSLMGCWTLRSFKDSLISFDPTSDELYFYNIRIIQVLFVGFYFKMIFPFSASRGFGRRSAGSSASRAQILGLAMSSCCCIALVLFFLLCHFLMFMTCHFVMDMLKIHLLISRGFYICNVKGLEASAT